MKQHTAGLANWLVLPCCFGIGDDGEVSDLTITPPVGSVIVRRRV
jgi:hypothetical protein